MSYRLVPDDKVSQTEACSLYDAVQWSTYTREPDGLMAAIRGSDFVVTARAGDTLIGLARALSDDVSIAYIQDILVHPDQQGSGIGRALLQRVLERYSHVRQKVLLTDNRPQQLQFYAAMGFKNTRELEKTPLNAFLIIEGANLE